MVVQCLIIDEVVCWSCLLIVCLIFVEFSFYHVIHEFVWYNRNCKTCSQGVWQKFIINILLFFLSLFRWGLKLSQFQVFSYFFTLFHLAASVFQSWRPRPKLWMKNFMKIIVLRKILGRLKTKIEIFIRITNIFNSKKYI